MERITVDEAARALRLSKTAVYALINANRLPAYRLGVKGGAIRLDPADVERYLQSTRATPDPDTDPRKKPEPKVGGFKHLGGAGYSYSESQTA